MKKILFTCLCLLFSLGPAFAQQAGMSPEEKEKKLTEAIDKEVERLETTLQLEDWQVFYADSILNHDYRALQEELEKLQSYKVSNRDLYTQASDKWFEQIYESMRSVLNEEQWAKYLKAGAGREKKARDKRKAKK